jgi:hypothetical protein
MSISELTQAPLTFILVMCQHLQRLGMVNIELGEHRRDGSIIAVIFKEYPLQLSVIQITDGGGLQNPLSMNTNEVQVDIFEISRFMLLVMISEIHESDNINLPAYFAKALQAAGWDETRPTMLMRENGAWTLSVCKSCVAT